MPRGIGGIGAPCGVWWLGGIRGLAARQWSMALPGGLGDWGFRNPSAAGPGDPMAGGFNARVIGMGLGGLLCDRCVMLNEFKSHF